jgi:hypothetical protein
MDIRFKRQQNKYKITNGLQKILSPRYIIIKWSKVKDKERTLKALQKSDL